MYDPARGYPSAVPYVLYRDPAAASTWIAEVTGFREILRFTVPEGGPVGHVELERDGTIQAARRRHHPGWHRRSWWPVQRVEQCAPL